jgi:hypothetical protein
VTPIDPPHGAEPPVPQPISDAADRPSRRRGHARRNEADRFEPTGDYSVGFARPPKQHRFSSGNPGGPGRPKGSVSHDTILRKELKQKRPVRIDGRTMNLTTRDLLLKTMIKDALGGDKAARKLLWGELGRLFPNDVEALRAPSPAEYNASDRQSLEELKKDLLDGLFDGDDIDTSGDASDQDDKDADDELDADEGDAA